MNRPQDNRFYHYAACFLRDEFPEKTKVWDDAKLKSEIDKGLLAAHRSGFSGEADAMGFIDLDWRFDGALSAKTPDDSIQAVFDSNESADVKLDCLRDLYCAREWEKMKND